MIYDQVYIVTYGFETSESLNIVYTAFQGFTITRRRINIKPAKRYPKTPIYMLFVKACIIKNISNLFFIKEYAGCNYPNKKRPICY